MVAYYHQNNNKRCVSRSLENMSHFCQYFASN